MDSIDSNRVSIDIAFPGEQALGQNNKRLKQSPYYYELHLQAADGTTQFDSWLVFNVEW